MAVRQRVDQFKRGNHLPVHIFDHGLILLPLMEKGAFRRILFCPTGALMSPTSSQQGETIPGVAHAVVLESPVEKGRQ